MNKKTLEVKTKLVDNLINSYQKRHLFKYNTPMTMTFLITNRCNLSCKHCFNNKICDDNKELTLDEYEKLSKSMTFFASALFCGGEPFIRQDFSEIVSLFRKNCNLQYSSTTTNGQLINSILSQTQSICESDKEKRFVLNFSLDGFENEHDNIRGKNTYKNCIETIKECIKLKSKYSNLQIGIVSTMNTINEECLSEFFDYINHKINPDVISLLLTRQSPRDGEYLKHIKPENYTKAKEKLNSLFIKGKNGDLNSPLSYIPLSFYDFISQTLKNGKRSFYCYAGQHGGYIDYDGYVNTCEIIGDINNTSHPMHIGNLRDYDMDFLKLWNSEQAYMVRNKVNRHECCENCTHETEGLLPSIYFEPNSYTYKERMRKIVKNI